MMEKGKGKCIVCGHDEFAQGVIRLSVEAETPNDLSYFHKASIHACTNCGFIQLTSKKVMS